MNKEDEISKSIKNKRAKQDNNEISLQHYQFPFGSHKTHYTRDDQVIFSRHREKRTQVVPIGVDQLLVS
jgi:hypothetical protein